MGEGDCGEGTEWTFYEKIIGRGWVDNFLGCSVCEAVNKFITVNKVENVNRNFKKSDLWKFQFYETKVWLLKT